MSALRGAALSSLLGLVWLVSPAGVPLYDGVGLPDEPYRFVPPATASARPATAASVRLRVVGGVNDGGLIANSAEQGPQVSVYAPPQAFATTTAATSLTVSATPVTPTPPEPPGERSSNSYLLRFVAAGLPATLRPQAQAPTITMRVADADGPPPLFAYRPAPSEPWRALAARAVGADVYTTTVPGAGEYVLVRSAPAPSARAPGRGLPALGLAAGAVGVLLLVAVLLGLRRRRLR